MSEDTWQVEFASGGSEKYTAPAGLTITDFHTSDPAVLIAVAGRVWEAGSVTEVRKNGVKVR